MAIRSFGKPTCILNGRVFLISALLAVAALAFVIVAALWNMAGAAAAERKCATAVAADWAVDGRVDRRYPASCYHAAIDSLPEDLRAYSSAEDDIRRALQSSVRRQS